ncbi:MBL fold metallo-hydrolase [Kosakonia sp. BK9b]
MKHSTHWQVPAIQRQQLGNLSVTIISDGYLEGSFSNLNGIDAHRAESVLADNGVSCLPRMNINVCVVEYAGRTILIDSGTGANDGASGQLQDALAAAGIDPLQIDTLLLTHAHPDHIGGVADAAQKSLFANVQQLWVHEKELAFWRDENVYTRGTEHFKRLSRIACHAFNTWDDRLVTFRQEDILPGIQAVPLFGHTPGHCGFLLGNERASLLIWGDIVHFPHIQITHPEVSVSYDFDPAQAAKTRLALLDRVSADNLSVCGMHFNLPSTASITRRGNGYALHYAM